MATDLVTIKKSTLLNSANSVLIPRKQTNNKAINRVKSKIIC